MLISRRRTQRGQDTRQTDRTRPRLRDFETLEERCLLAPTVVSGTAWQPFGTVGATTDGFVSVRLLSTVTGRIEADPTGLFGGDVYVVSRGIPQAGGGIIPPAPPDAIGTIYRVDPYATLGSGFGITDPAQNKKVFGYIPGGAGADVDIDAYTAWFDIAFDYKGVFSRVNGGPTMFISVADQDDPGPGVNPLNGIYAFLPDGSLVANPTPPFNTNLWAFSRRNVAPTDLAPQLDRLDNSPVALALGPGGSFGTDLYVMDGVDDDFFDAPPDRDGNVLWRVSPGIPAPIDLDATAVLHPQVEEILPRVLMPTPNDPDLAPYVSPVDMDVRAMVFHPGGGVISGGFYGTPAQQVYGGLFMAISDVRFGEVDGVTRIVHFPSITSPPVDLIGPRTILDNPNVTGINAPPMLIGDMTIDPVGFFGGGLFFTDYQSKSVRRLWYDPATDSWNEEVFATGFNVPDPDAFPPDPADTDPGFPDPNDDLFGAAAALRVPFSISFSADGQILFVSDADGVWAFYANTLPHTPGGSYIGLTDLKELRAPYDGSGFAAAVIDTGVDGDHLGFQGTVAPGFNTAFTGPGNVDPDGHGTAVAGIIHQIAPEAVIVPVNVLGFGFTAQDLYTAVKWVRQNPFADDPRTPKRERYPIVAANMSLGIRFPDDPDNNVDSDRHAVQVNKSEAIPLKFEFRRFYKASRYGIVPVGAAGNEGQFFNGMDGSIIPAVLNEVVEVIAAYPYGPVPPGEAPPITSDLTLRCQLEPGDNIAFPGKITAFSSRNVVSDYAAPGTCVSTFGLSSLGLEGPDVVDTNSMAPILPDFNGTSAAAPVTAGSFVLGYDVLDLWYKVRRKGGRIRPNDPALKKLHQYLVRDLSGVPSPNMVLRIPRSAIPNFGAYLNPDGVNSIFQWTAVPREDVNIGETYDFPTGTDDDVKQERLLFSDRYRTYSHINIANFVAAVEGSIALRYFRLNPQYWRALARAAGTPGIITVQDIDRFVANPAIDPTARAMARLLGGGDRLARINRLRFLDLVADERPDNYIGVRQLNRLIRRLLPGPNSFPIQNRWKAARKGYALDSQAMRNYRDLIYLSREHMLWTKLPPEFANKSPRAFSSGARGRSPLMLLPVTDSQAQRGGGSSSGNARSYQPVTPGQPMAPEGTDQQFVQPGIDNLAGLNADGLQMTFTFGPGGQLRPFLRTQTGWQPSEPVMPTDGQLGAVSYMATVDRDGEGYYDVYGLAINGHLIRYAASPTGWTIEDVTATTGGPALSGALRAIRLHDPQTGAEQVIVAGVDRNGRLIAYELIGGVWTVRNVTQLANLERLSDRTLAVTHRADDAEAIRGALLYAVRRDGQLVEIVRTGDGRWISRPVEVRDRVPRIVAGLAAREISENGRIVRRVLGIDRAGNLVMYEKRGRRWSGQPVSMPLHGPRLQGELELYYDETAQRTYVIGRTKDGQLVVYELGASGWDWSVRNDVPLTGDVAATNTGDVLVESIDGAIAELLFGGPDPLSDWALSYVSSGDQDDSSDDSGLDGGGV